MNAVQRGPKQNQTRPTHQTDSIKLKLHRYVCIYLKHFLPNPSPKIKFFILNFDSGNFFHRKTKHSATTIRYICKLVCSLRSNFVDMFDVNNFLWKLSNDSICLPNESMSLKHVCLKCHYILNDLFGMKSSQFVDSIKLTLQSNFKWFNRDNNSVCFSREAAYSMCTNDWVFTRFPEFQKYKCKSLSRILHECWIFFFAANFVSLFVFTISNISSVGLERTSCTQPNTDGSYNRF